MSLTEEQVRERIRQECETLAGGQREWAKRHSISPQYVNDVLVRNRAPGKLFLRALGLRRVVRYEEA